MLFTRTGRHDDTFYALNRLGERYKTSTFKALSTGIDSGLEAPGSLREDVDAAFVQRELSGEMTPLHYMAKIEGMGVPMSKEEYEDSTFFRDNVEYREGMTVAVARVLSQREDALQERNFLIQQSEGFVANGAFFVGALLGSVADVKNLIAGVAAGGAYGLGAKFVSAARTAKNVMATANNSRTAALAANTSGTMSLAARGGKILTESTLATIPAVTTGLQNEPILATEYGIGDAFLDLGASAIFSVALASGTRGVRRVYNKYANISDRVDVADIARAQFRANEHIDVETVMEAQMAEKVQPFSTLRPNDKPTVRVKKDGTAEARFDAEDGTMAGIKAKGATPEEALINLQRMYREDIEGAAKQLDMHPDQLKLVRDVQDLKQQHTEFNLDDAIIDVADEGNINIDEFRAADKALSDSRIALEKSEASLAKRKSSAKRQSDVANAKQKVLRSENHLQELRESEGMREIVNESLARRKVLGDMFKNKSDALKAVQREKIAASLTQFVSEQTDPEASLKRTRDPVLKAMNPDEVKALAEQAPAPQAAVKPSIEARQQIEERLKSDTLDTKTREILEEGLEGVDNAKKRSQALKDWWKCRGGG